MRIRTHLVVMAAAILVPIALAAGIALEKIREGARDTALRGLKETVRATALTVDGEVRGAMSGLQVLGNSPSLRAGRLQDFYGEAAALNRPPDVYTQLLDSDGQQLVNTYMPPGTPTAPANPVSRARVAQVLSTGKPMVSDLLYGPVTGKPLVALYMPVAAGGAQMVLSQSFFADYWHKAALQASLPPGWIVAVVDRQGKFIARSHRSQELLGRDARPELVAAAAGARDGLIRHSTVEGIEAYDAFTHSELTGWTIAVAAPVALVEEAGNEAMRFAMGGMLLALGAALVAAIAFGQRLVRSIEGAGRAAVLLGQGLRPKAATSSIDEVRALHQVMAEAGAMLESERRSRQAAEAERERLLASETTAREAAQAQNVAKDQFLAMLGHELRNPLAAISGATTLLGMGGVERGRTERYLDIIRRQNRHLGHIVNDLLDVSRLMAGKIDLERGPLDMAACVRNCVEALRSTDRAIGYSIRVDAQPVWVDGDAVRIEQIVNNLVTNALKFSPTGGEVRIEVHNDGGQAAVSVSDDGTGIAPDLLARVFEPFVQGPAPANRAQSGLGIGLALVKQLVELHGGVVHATSAGPGEGSTFSFWIPAIAAPSSASQGDAGTSASARKLVYVEDNEDARATMAELLRGFGYDVVEVPDGEGAQPAVAAARPDAVVLDIGLPGIDGYEVARRLRQDPGNRDLPVIALTGYGQLRDREAAREAGFDLHLVKPVEPQQLVEAIEAACGRGRSA